jgi:hypothetical protein
VRWLNPWAFLGLMAVAVPVLVHLFSRRPARTLLFPTLRFLSDSRLLPTRRTRLTDVPLLAVRAAILALVALALAQPFLSSSEPTSSPRDDLARAIIVRSEPSLDAPLRPANAAPLEQAISALEDSSATYLRIPATSPHAALGGAVAWLRTQIGLGEIVVVSDPAHDAVEPALDSTDIANIPGDIGISFVQVPAAAVADTSVRARVVWITEAPLTATDAVRRAVQDIGGLGAAEVRVVSAQTAFVDTVRALASDSLRTVVVATSDGTRRVSGAPWQSSASAPWIGTTIVAITRDSTVGVTAATTRGSVVGLPGDTVVTDGVTVLARDANGAPLSAARVVRAGSGPPLLLIFSRAHATHVHSAALLLASSRLLGRPTSRSAAGEASMAALDSQQRAWTRAPIARSDVRERMPADTDARESLGRWLWLVVLALLCVEWLLRRRITSSAIGALAVDGS